MPRAALAVMLALVATSGCTSVATDCADPPLVTTSGDFRFGQIGLHLWQPDGQRETLASRLADYSAALSPDGEYVAYPAPEGQHGETYGYPKSRVAVMSLESRKVTLVSADLPDTTVINLQWSVDGSAVAFTRLSNGGPRKIVAARVEDGDERILLELENGRQFGMFAWNSVRRELLVPTEPTTSPRLPALPKGELRRYSTDTGQYTVVDTPHELIDRVAWSPDGRLLAMAANIPGAIRTRLYVLDVSSGSSTAVDLRRGGPFSMTWAGPYLFYSYEVSTPDDRLYLMRWDSRSKDRQQVDRPGLDDVLGRFGAISAPRCTR